MEDDGAFMRQATAPVDTVDPGQSMGSDDLVDAGRGPEPGASLNVVQVIDRLQRPGGAEALMVTLARAMRPLPVNLTIVTIKPSDPDMVAEIEALGAEVRPFSAPKLVHPGRMVDLYRYLRENEIDLVHTHLTGATILGAIAARLAGIPVVTTIHNTVFRADRHLYHGRLERWLLQNVVQTVIGVGKKTAEITRSRLNGHPVRAIANAVADAPKLAPSRRQRLRAEMGMTDGGSDDLLLVWAGRMTEQKGLFDLLVCFQGLCSVDPGVRLALAGEGALFDQLKTQADKLGIADRLSFLGLRNDVAELFAASDLYVSASHWEGFPIATLEAMSVGLPVVATAVGDVPTILEGGAGITVPPGRPDLLAAEIGKVIDDATLRHRLGQRARQRIDDSYRAESWAQAHLNLYCEVLGAA